MDIEKIPPQNLEAEMSVLGSILIDKDSVYKIKLSPEMFYFSKHQTIFSAILELKESNDPIDIVTLSNLLEEKNSLEQIGKRSYLAKLASTVVSSSHVEKYSDIIFEKFQRRKMMEQMENGMKSLYDEEKSNEEVLNSIKKGIVDIKSNNKYLVEENPNMILDWYENYDKQLAPAIKTGITGLDQAFGGFTGTEFALILAGTNVGKTSLLLNMALNMAKNGIKVLFFSLEMSSDQLNNKLIAMSGDHSAFDIKNKMVTKGELKGTVEEFKDYPLTIIHRGAITSNDVISEAYTRKMQDKVDIVMVDYIQRLTDQSKESETLRMGNIARNLKNFALTNNIPVITPAQVDKASSKSGKIEVENVAWAKALADEADLALYLYEKKNQSSIIEDEEPTLHLKIVKSRESGKYQDFIIDFNRTNLRMVDGTQEIKNLVGNL